MKKNTLHYQFYFDTLRKTNNFSRLPDNVLHEMLSIFYVEIWSKGKLSFYGEKTLHNFHFIISGRVKMYQIHPKNGNEHTLYINSTGDFFDIICLLDQNKHSIEIEALDDVVLLSAPTDIVRKWILIHPDFNTLFMPYIAKQLRHMEEKANDLVFYDTWTRMLKLFLKHAKENIEKTELKLINNLTNSEIANIIGTSKNIVNRHIQELKKKNIIELKHREIVLKNHKKLLELIENNEL